MAVYKLTTEQAVAIYVLERALSVYEFQDAVFQDGLWPAGSQRPPMTAFKTARAGDILVNLARAGFAETDGQTWKLTPPGKQALKAIRDVGLAEFLAPPPPSPAQALLPGANSVRDVQHCPRCGQDHIGMVFRELTRADSRHTHYAVCPVTNEPLMTWSGVLSAVPAAAPTPEERQGGNETIDPRPVAGTTDPATGGMPDVH